MYDTCQLTENSTNANIKGAVMMMMPALMMPALNEKMKTCTCHKLLYLYAESYQ